MLPSNNARASTRNLQSSQSFPNRKSKIENPKSDNRKFIYVEILIDCPIDEIWQKTRSPDLHRRWDLRFTGIEYLPRSDESQPQRFLYTTRIGFGMSISGEGESTGSRDGALGERTSALRFWSDDPKSLIREGSGYWKYIPTDRGIRFLTWYDYRTRFGAAGRLFDAMMFRSLIGWATAWSFDRLRLWIEKEIDPALSMERSLVYLIARCMTAFIFIYHGLVPKLLFRHTGELELLMAGGLDAGSADMLMKVLAFGEIAFGILLLIAWRNRWPLVAAIVLMGAATIGIAFTSPRVLVAAFNPLTLNLSVAALATIALLSSRNLPSASHTLRTPPSNRT